MRRDYAAIAAYAHKRCYAVLIAAVRDHRILTGTQERYWFTWMKIETRAIEEAKRDHDHPAVAQGS